MNFHPPLVSIPVALIGAVVIFELSALLPAARPYRQMIRFAIKGNVLLCFIGILAAFFSGYPAGENASQSFVVPQGAIGDHHLVGRFLLFSSIPWVVLCFCREYAKFNRKLFEICYYLMLALCLGLTLYCGYLGGNLVFEHGAGVRAQIEVNTDTNSGEVK